MIPQTRRRGALFIFENDWRFYGISIQLRVRLLRRY